MTIKERLEDMADRLDDLALSELLREAIEAIDETEGEALEHEQHADRVEAELSAANAKVDALEAQLAESTAQTADLRRMLFRTECAA